MRVLGLCLLLALGACAPTPRASLEDAPALPSVSAGRIERLAIQPRELPPRPVDVWLPPGYPAAAPYPVIYMHDGQMLFDAGITWNRQEWRVDEVAAELIASGEVPAFIVVGVWNAGPDRQREYFPQRVYEALEESTRETLRRQQRAGQRSLDAAEVRSDAYLRFLVDELKPRIDRDYRTATDRSHTFVMGSSMGGLISMYAALEYPEVFGAAACLSTHWPGAIPFEPNPIPAAFRDYLSRRLPAPGWTRLYFDLGDATLDAYYPPLQAEVDALLRARGYGPAHWESVYVPGAEHSETAWAARLDRPLRFLLGNLPPRQGAPSQR